jgi:transposase
MSAKAHSAIAVIGIDIGKNSFHVVGQDKRGAIMLRQKWSRGQAEARLANLPPCLIGMRLASGRIISAASCIRSGALTSAQIIQFAPYLARKQEQEVERLLARRHSPLVDCGNVRARVAALVQWSATLSSSHEGPHPFQAHH